MVVVAHIPDPSLDLDQDPLEDGVVNDDIAGAQVAAVVPRAVAAPVVATVEKTRKERQKRLDAEAVLHLVITVQRDPLLGHVVYVLPPNFHFIESHHRETH